ncbi:hypothetical protein MNBD_GAMMA18-2067 [hydrothermal vent metagenome]|uniref:Uncharacterized protein n=1 Tax=hydrothermal vent metagenome TaxID=652676 RepID=A0A3B0ZAX2_9ZZZZ
MTKVSKIHADGSSLNYEGMNTIKLKSQTEVHKGALSDPDAPPLTNKDLDGFKRVNPRVKNK